MNSLDSHLSQGVNFSLSLIYILRDRNGAYLECSSGWNVDVNFERYSRSTFYALGISGAAGAATDAMNVTALKQMSLDSLYFWRLQNYTHTVFKARIHRLCSGHFSLYFSVYFVAKSTSERNTWTEMNGDLV